jgi:TfoX/Sxy family transcriptional regulator of competence genes
MATGSGRKPPPGASPGDPAFARVLDAFSRERGVTTGTMMASVGLKVDGKIFAMLVRGKLVAKLPKDRVDALVEAGAGKRFDPRHDGRVMKEWIELEGREPPWIELAREAHRFVKGARR